MRRRGIDAASVDAVLAAPGRKVPGHGAISCYRSRVSMGGKTYLPRIMVDETKRPPVVVTVYRTGKIAKYRAKP